jgi:Cu-Zn family superoxide dismutase
LVTLSVSGLLACKTGGSTGPSAGKGTRAVAELRDPSGAPFGRVTLTEESMGVVGIEMEVNAATSTLATEGDHAIHIHEGSECTPPTFASAGGHFNPTNAKHGSPEGAGHHAGDLGNIEIDGERKGDKKLNTIELTLAPGQPNTAVGRTVIIHAKKDDFVTQNPPGNAGGRIACGVITLESTGAN